MGSLNHHLNIFRFFNESAEKEFTENNLSRAFAICLANDALFLNEYFKAVVDDEDYSYLFSVVHSDDECTINLQIDTAQIDRDMFKTVYAVAMTTNESLTLKNFFEQDMFDKRNISDIFISIKDIAIIIEVKRTEENCERQLFNQLIPFVKENGDSRYKIVPLALSWQSVVHIMERVRHLHRLTGPKCVMIDDFLELAETRYVHWFKPKPFHLLPFSSSRGSVEILNLEKRIRQAFNGVEDIGGAEFQILSVNDRLSLKLPFEWASELIPGFEEDEAMMPCISFYVWPGNTKEQGKHIFSGSLDWLRTRTINVAGIDYPISITYNVKLSHFMGKFISEINYTEDDIDNPLHTQSNFYENSGRWERDEWSDFETMMGFHFKEEFDWKGHCEWEEKFLNSGRNFLFLSLGFEVSVKVPYTVFTRIDRKEGDEHKVSQFIYDVIEGYRQLI